ncbi:MAG: MBL fold metallo-hydrolase [Methanobacteriota archaeon]
MTNGVSNFYLIEDEGRLLLVDAGTPRDWDVFMHAASTLGRNPNQLEAILLTHAHPDHTGFAERGRTDAGAAVWIHEADAAVAKGGTPGKNEGRLLPYLRYAESWRTWFRLARRGGTKLVPILEVSVFTDGQTIEAPGRPRAIHVPGHTPGMAAVFFEHRRALLTGDCLVTRNPLTGRKGPQVMPSALNRDTGQALRSLSALEEIPAHVMLPGHGEPWTEGAREAVRLARTAARS